MDWFVTRFLKAGLTWLALGVSLGLLLVFWPAGLIYRPAHLHLNLLGFVTMTISGVAYHVIPRFTGHPLHSRRLAGVHWWASNLGLTLITAGFLARPHLAAWTTPLLGTGGALSALGAYLFVYNLWRTLDGPRGSRRPSGDPTPGQLKPLPVVDRGDSRQQGG